MFSWIIIIKYGSKIYWHCPFYAVFRIRVLLARSGSFWPDPDWTFFVSPGSDWDTIWILNIRIRILKNALKLYCRQCCGAGAGRSRGFLAWAGADLQFELEPEPEPIFWVGFGSFFLASEKQNDLKMFIFHCILYCIYFQCCGSGMIYFGSSFEYSEFRIWIQAKVPEPCGSRSNRSRP